MVTCAQLRILALGRLSYFAGFHKAAPAVFAAPFSESFPLIATHKALVVYEPWFGHPAHISIGDSSQDP